MQNRGEKKTLSLELFLRHGWVPNVCPQWCWITRTVHIANNATGNDTYLSQDQLGLPNSFRNRAQPQARHPCQPTRHMDKPTHPLPHMAFMCPLTCQCNPKPQIPSPPYSGATSSKQPHQLSAEHLALFHGCADHYARAGYFPPHSPAS